jgi:hypothetical protein
MLKLAWYKISMMSSLRLVRFIVNLPKDMWFIEDILKNDFLPNLDGKLEYNSPYIIGSDVMLDLLFLSLSGPCLEVTHPHSTNYQLTRVPKKRAPMANNFNNGEAMLLPKSSSFQLITYQRQPQSMDQPSINLEDSKSIYTSSGTCSTCLLV